MRAQSDKNRLLLDDFFRGSRIERADGNFTLSANNPKAQIISCTIDRYPLQDCLQTKSRPTDEIPGRHQDLVPVGFAQISFRDRFVFSVLEFSASLFFTFIMIQIVDFIQYKEGAKIENGLSFDRM